MLICFLLFYLLIGLSIFILGETPERFLGYSLLDKLIVFFLLMSLWPVFLVMFFVERYIEARNQ